MATSDEDAAVEPLNTVDEGFVCLTESRYIYGCSSSRIYRVREPSVFECIMFDPSLTACGKSNLKIAWIKNQRIIFYSISPSGM